MNPIALSNSIWMTPILLILALMTMGAAVFQPVQQDPEMSTELTDFLKDLLNQEKMSWRLQQVYDPYSRRPALSSDLDKTQVLTFYSEGSYTERQNGQKKAGSWTLDMKNQMIQFQSDHGDVRGPKEKLSCMIKSYQKDRLILSLRGRHGWVDKIYVLI